MPGKSNKVNWIIICVAKKKSENNGRANEIIEWIGLDWGEGDGTAYGSKQSDRATAANDNGKQIDWHIVCFLLSRELF